MRPSTDVYLPIDLCGGTKGRLRITPAGAVTVVAQDGRRWSDPYASSPSCTATTGWPAMLVAQRSLLWAIWSGGHRHPAGAEDVGDSAPQIAGSR
jgi:hypothetical protein